MVITWHGLGCFRITEQTQDGEVALVIDPHDGKLPRNLVADVVVSTQDSQQHRTLDAVGGDPFVISGPGEYERKGIFIDGVALPLQGEGKATVRPTMFHITVGDVGMLHVGGVDKTFEDSLVEAFGAIDVLFVPVGGSGVLNGAKAAELVRELEPRLIVPMMYGEAGYDGVEPFLKVMGGAKPETLPKLKLSRRELPQNEMKIVLLERQ